MLQRNRDLSTVRLRLPVERGHRLQVKTTTPLRLRADMINCRDMCDARSIQIHHKSTGNEAYFRPIPGKPTHISRRMERHSLLSAIGSTLCLMLLKTSCHRATLPYLRACDRRPFRFVQSYKAPSDADVILYAIAVFRGHQW